MKYITKDQIIELLNDVYNNIIEDTDSNETIAWKKCIVYEESFDIIKNNFNENQLNFTDDELEDITTEWLD